METINLGESLEKKHTPTEAIKIVVRYANGRIFKGYTQNFSPNKPTFLVFQSSDGTSSQTIEVHISDLKALFFVRDFQGNPGYDEHKKFIEDKRPVGRKVEVIFKDGEVLVGTTVGYDPLRSGFFLYPADPQSNNLRVFAISASVRKVRYL